MLDQIMDELAILLRGQTGRNFRRDQLGGKTLMSLAQNHLPTATVLCQKIETHFGIEPLPRWGAMNIREIAEEIVIQREEA